MDKILEKKTDKIYERRRERDEKDKSKVATVASGNRKTERKRIEREREEKEVDRKGGDRKRG
jgi:hypothetical protein